MRSVGPWTKFSTLRHFSPPTRPNGRTEVNDTEGFLATPPSFNNKNRDGAIIISTRIKGEWGGNVIHLISFVTADVLVPVPVVCPIGVYGHSVRLTHDRQSAKQRKSFRTKKMFVSSAHFFAALLAEQSTKKWKKRPASQGRKCSQLINDVQMTLKNFFNISKTLN